jgi:hypothetical protein
VKNTKTAFAAVGDNVLSYVGSGSPSRPQYGTLEAKGTMGRGSSPTGTKANRGATMIKEANGPKCTITGVLYKANAAEASATERNVRIMPSAASAESDFWKARKVTGQAY